MHRKFTLLLLLASACSCLRAQQHAADTVIIPLAETSKIIFTLGDPRDLDILKYYNFQELFDDVLEKLEQSHATSTDSSAVAIDEATEQQSWETGTVNSNSEDEETQEAEHDHDEFEGDHNNKWVKSRRGKIGQTWQSYNVDLGTNNYLLDDQFPTGSEPYAVRPWGSWYVAVNSVQRTKLGQNVFVEWGLGVSWYNFKFQEDNTRVYRDEAGVHFTADNRNVEYIKSKLSATFINASLVPVVDFGEHSRKPRIWDGHGGGFRLGIGPYVGYRIGSKSKLVFEEEGDRVKEKDRDNFNLNNLRYGFRVQIGVRSTDLFINYDMNDLFAENKGPRLNAVSFGLIL